MWDSYPDQSLTRLTREKGGYRTKVQGVNTHPWWLEQFLKRPENKADLFRFIGQEMVND